MINIWRERPGVVSPGVSWCAVYGGGTVEKPTPCYMHVQGSLLGLLIELLTEHHTDRHLVG